MTRIHALGAAVAATLLMAAGANAATLDDVKAKGFIQCGVNTGAAGFSAPDDAGNWRGFDVDVCRGMSAAIFGDPDKVKYTPLTAKVRFTALQSGEIDVLSRNTTWTFSRDSNLGLDFTAVNFYDGQGFMVRKDLGVTSASQLNGASVCIQTGTTTELNLADFFRSSNMSFSSVVVEDANEARLTYDSGRCDVYTTDRSGLASQRSLMSNPDDHIVLPEVISKEPLGPVVRHDDNQWGDIVRWTLNAMIIAEELGVSSQNVDQMKDSNIPEVRRLLGTEGAYGEMLGLSNDWAYRIVKLVGNYAEVFDRHIGPDTPIALDRGINALWTDGGILYAPPMR